MNGPPPSSGNVPPRPGGAPEMVALGTVPDSALFTATAQLLGGRVDTREVALDPVLAALVPAAGLTFVFRFGVAVTIAAGPALPDTDALLAALRIHVSDPITAREVESAQLALASSGGDRIGPQGRILLADTAPERLQLAATVLARSVLLARDETLVSEAFDRIAPLVADLRQNGRVRLAIHPVMRLLGEVLSARHRVLATVQADERPDLLWDNPGLDRLYDRLEDEYELGERATALQRKFAALGDFAEVLLDLAQDKRAFRLEAAIIALIAFELCLSLFKMVFP